MNTSFRILALAAVTASVLTATAAQAGDRAGAVVSGAWLRPAAAGMAMTSGYLVIRNPTAKPMRLRAASSPAAHSVTLHRSVVSGGVARMEALADGLVIPPGGSAIFQPGGNHLMLEGLVHPLKVGDRVTVKLTFDAGPPLDATFEVRGAAPEGPMPAGMKMR
jgi:copper(I)-binding protein